MIEIFSCPPSMVEPCAGSQAVEFADVDVWIWTLDPPSTEVTRALTYLAGDELELAARFATAALASRWSMARARLRQILARYVGCEPKELVFQLGPHGKPCIAAPLSGTNLHFNLSHSHGIAGVAVSRDLAVGFDLEIWKEAPLEVAPDVFSAEERAELATYGGREKHAAFLRGWTRKEAFIKALGVGLSYPLSDFEVSLARDAPSILRAQFSNLTGWELIGIEERDLFLGTLAALSGDRKLRVRALTPENLG